MNKRVLAILLTVCIAFSFGSVSYAEETEPLEEAAAIEKVEAAEDEEAVEETEAIEEIEDEGEAETVGGTDVDSPSQGAGEYPMILDKVEGSNIETFYIERPDPNALKDNIVNASKFGLSVTKEDNFDAFQLALDYCTEHPNTYLIIDKGVYSFKKDATLKLAGLKNVLIEGNGAEFIFETQKQFSLSGCDGVEFHNLIIDWNWEEKRIASLVRVQNKTSNSFEIVFLELEEVDENIALSSFQQYDNKEFVPGTYGSYKTFVPDEVPGSIESVEKVGRNVLKVNFTSKFTTTFHNEEVYLLRHYIYGGQVFSVNGSSKNITFDNVRIYGSAGMGFVVGDKSSYFQIINCYIGLRPGNEDKQRMSTTVDGIHILNTDGYFRIDNCDLSFTGDDIINIHDDMMKVLTKNTSTEVYGYVTGGFVQKGDTIRIYNSNIEDIGFETEVLSITRKSNTAVLTLQDALPEEVTKGYYIYRSSSSTHNYVISNNYIHETRGRAALLKSSYGLFENNKIYRTNSEAITVEVDISEKTGKTWYEGSGVTNVYIKNNEFIECEFGGKPTAIDIGCDVSNNKNIISDIHIENNQFSACFGALITADHVTDLYINNNIISDCGEITIGDNTGKVYNIDNTFIFPSKTCPHTDIMQVHDRQPSCYEYGSTGRTYCKQCHTIIESNYIGIVPLKHEDYQVKRIDVAPTCTASGASSMVCSLCGYVTKEGIEEKATGHNFVAYASDEASTMSAATDSSSAEVGVVSASHKCTECGIIVEHDNSGANGSCSICGYGKQVSVCSMSLELDTEIVDCIGINLYIDAPNGTVFYVDGAVIEPVKIDAAEKNPVENDTVGNDTAVNNSAGNNSAGNDTAGNNTVGNDTAGNNTVGNDSAVNDTAGNNMAGLYKIQYKCTPKELADQHTLTAVTDSNKSVEISGRSEYIYSGELYCKKVLAADGDYSDKVKAICSSLLEYSEQARYYFEYNTSGLVKENVSASLPTTGYVMKTTGEMPSGNAYLGSSLILGEEVTLRHYFAGDSKRFVYKCTDVSKYKVTKSYVGLTDKEAVFYVDIPVSYSNMSDMFELKMTANNGSSYTIKYGVVTYCRNVQEMSTNSDLADLCNALYNFSVAIANY